MGPCDRRGFFNSTGQLFAVTTVINLAAPRTKVAFAHHDGSIVGSTTV